MNRGEFVAGVLVTGANGFVGAHVVAQLAERGHIVVASDRTSPAGPVLDWWGDNRARITQVALDICDPRAVDDVMERYRPRGVIHAAALTDRSTGSLFQVNLGGAQNVLGAAGPVTKLLVSSASVYDEGAAHSECIREDDPVVSVPPDPAVWTYAQSKRASEEWALAHGGIRIARVAACFGPLERPTPNRTVMSVGYEAARAIAARKRVSVDFGWPSDLTYVSDTARAIVAFWGADTAHTIVNVASTSTATAEDVSSAANAAADHDWVASVHLTMSGRHRPLDTRRLQSIDPTEPIRLENAFRDYVRWLSAHDY